jgi:hypothetical protein
MKVYLFDPESGIYEGEDFCDNREINELDGMTLLEPSEAIPEHVKVYDPELRRWENVPIKAITDGTYA